MGEVAPKATFLAVGDSATAVATGGVTYEARRRLQRYSDIWLYVQWSG